MKAVALSKLWARWGLIPRLMAAVGFAIMAGGIVQNYLLALEGAAEHSARHERELNETLNFLAPLVADQAVLGDYAAIQQLLQQQAKKLEIKELNWTHRNGRKLTGKDAPDKREAPLWFSLIVPIQTVAATLEVETGGASYGTLTGEMNSIPATNRLWGQFVSQLQIVLTMLLLMLQLIWLIFRGNLGTLRMLAQCANRFSQGDHTVRVESSGAPDVRAAADAFNDMANNIESLIASLGASERDNRRLAAIVTQSSEAIWTQDLSGRITTWNAGATALFGYTAEEAVGHEIELDSRSSPAEQQARLGRVESGETSSYETKATTKSGREIDIEVAAAPLYDENNRVIGRIGVAHDVTERKRAEQELNTAREAAEAANLAKSTFLARMSHEIRTPMNGVLGMTELLLETGLTATQRKFAETAQRSGKTLLGIINDILDFSKIEAGKLDLEHIDFDVRQVIEDTVELLAERAQSKGLELTCAIPVDLPTRVKGDPLRLGQVLLNLVGNAIKFTETGEVTVSVACVEDAHNSAVLRFEVADTGPGISEEAQGRIFDNFSQADGTTTRKHGGTGLGLPISRQLVEMMGGMMTLESMPRIGSKFWFEVRFDKQTIIQGDAGQGSMLDGVRGLIVTSNATARNSLQAQIGNWGMHSRSVETPEQALSILQQAAGRGALYDVVIIDSALGGMGAIGLAKAIKAEARLSSARLVMLMPVGRHGDMNEARQAGIAMCLSKPVRQSALHDCLVTIMTRAGEAASLVQEETAAVSAGGHRGGKLLLAEDNPVNQEVALGILNIEGCDVTVAKNGVEAVEMFLQRTFDLVLMDCHMPEMDGFEATRKIRELEQQNAAAKRIPIIALTANAMQQDRDECLGAGMDDHLSKPYSRMQMRAMLERWLPQGAKEAASEGKAAADSEHTDQEARADLDTSALDALRDLESSGNPDLLRRLIDLYLHDAPELIKKINKGLEAGDAKSIGEAAHTLKSTSANLGARELASVCAALQDVSRSGSCEQAAPLVARIEPLYAGVASALRQEKSKVRSVNASA
jgi:PAS domain S-box-containing protein